MARCSDSKCRAPDMGCRRGEPTLTTCEAWTKSNAAAAADAKVEDSRQTLLPWSGSAMGTTDLRFLTGRADPKLIAILGPHNAGKTTLLGAWYQLLGRSGKIGERRFAGSFSLEGWEAVAHALRWEGGAPRFPAHTSSGVGRAPGLLHLALRDDADSLSDILFADAPGEWFHRWAVQRDAPDAEGARWLSQRASVMMIIADCESLAGASRGTARSNLVQLVRRVADERRGRPVALIWSKADIEISSGIRDAVRSAAQLVMPDLVEFAVSVIDRPVGEPHVDAADALLKVLAWAVQPMPRGIETVETPIPSNDPFFALGAA